MTDYRMTGEGLDEIINLFEKPKTDAQLQSEMLDAILCQLTALTSEVEKLKEAVYTLEYKTLGL